MSVKPSPKSAVATRARARAKLCGELFGSGMLWEEVAQAAKVSESTARHCRDSYPDEFHEGFAIGLAKLEIEHIPRAIQTQATLLDGAEKDEVRAKVAADLRAEHGRSLDRLTKAEGILIRIAEEDIAPRFDAAVVAALACVPEGSRDECERAMRAAFAA